MADGNGVPTLGELGRIVEKQDERIKALESFQLRMVGLMGAVTIVSFLLGLAASTLRDVLTGK